MKKIVFLLVLLLGSCNLKEIYESQVTRYVIVNNSSYKMDVFAFNKKKNIGKFTLQPKQTHTKNIQFRHSGYYLFDNFADSVSIIFDNKRVINQYCNGTLLNLAPNNCQWTVKNLGNMNYADYKKVNKKRNGVRILEEYSYTFDDSDYRRAVEKK